MIDVDVLYSVSAIGTQILLTRNNQHVIVDAGDGIVRDLVSRKVDFDNIRGILLTHEHFDHFSGLYSLLHFVRLQRRKEQFTVILPRPARVVPYLLKPPVMYEPIPFEVRLIELGAGERASVGELEASAFGVKHGSGNSLGYSIRDQEGFRVVVSGDSACCSSLEHNVQGADIAVLDATYADDDEDLAAKNWHMTRSEALNLGRGAKRIILVHSNPEYYFRKFQCSVK